EAPKSDHNQIHIKPSKNRERSVLVRFEFREELVVEKIRGGGSLPRLPNALLNERLQLWIADSVNRHRLHPHRHLPVNLGHVLALGGVRNLPDFFPF
ncbi:hypothetical protein U1Q18_049932, partial [Sarracenia purpurea var. burkii]